MRLKPLQMTQGTCSNKLGTIFKQCLKPLFHLMTVEIPQYYPQIEYTKCLNTAIIFTFMIGNLSYVEESEFCEVKNIKNRFKSLPVPQQKEHNIKTFEDLQKQLLQKPAKKDKREFFYILLTNGQFKRVQNVQDTEQFPGHVFIIEKYYNDEERMEFAIYQSYINHYDLSQFGNDKNTNAELQTNGKMCSKKSYMRPNFKLSTSDIQNEILEGLKYIAYNTVWDEQTVGHWCQITHTNSKQFVDTNYHGQLIFCFKKFEFDSCLKNFRKFLIDKMTFIDNGIETHFKENDIYGLTYLKQQSEMQEYKKQYTYGEMRQYVCRMIKNINSQLGISLDNCKQNDETLKRVYNFQYKKTETDKNCSI